MHEVMKRVVPLANKTELLKVTPVGPNNSGKSYFVNNLAMAKNLDELATAKIPTIPEFQLRWANFLPVESSSLGRGGEVVTLFPTVLRFIPHGFKVKLELTSEADFKLRLKIYQQRLSNRLPSPEFAQLRDQLGQFLQEHFPPAFQEFQKFQQQQLLDGGKEIVSLFEKNEPSNIFEQLHYFRTSVIKDLEVLVRNNPILCWMFVVVVEGNFKNLNDLGIQIIDVSLFAFPLQFF